MTAARHLWIAIFALLAVNNYAHAVIRVWNNPAGGSWWDSANWTPTGYPEFGDPADITLAETYTVLIDSGFAYAAGVTVGGGSGLQTLVISGPNVELGLDGSSTVNANGRMQVSDNGRVQIMAPSALALDPDRVLSNSGVLIFDPTSSLVLSEFANGNALVNEMSGTVIFDGNVVVDTDLAGTPQSGVVNNGIMTKTGSGVLDVRVPFYQSMTGTFTVQSGEVLASYFNVAGYLTLESGTIFTVTVRDTNSALWIDTAATVELQGTASILATDPVAANIHNNGFIRHTGSGTGVIDCEHEHEVYGEPFFGQVIAEEGTLHFRGVHNFSFFGLVEVGPEAEIIFDNNAEFSAPAEVASAVPDSGTLTFRNAYIHQVWFCDFTFSGILQLHGPGLVQLFPTNTLDTLQVLRADSGVVCDANQPIYTHVFELNGGTINTDVIVIEEQSWTSGGLGDGTGDSVTIEPGATLEVSGPEDKSLDGSTLTIEGTANVGGSGVITATNGANIIVDEAGTLAIGDSVTITSPADSLINTGYMTISSPLDTSTLDIFVFNMLPVSRTPGTIDILAGRTIITNGCMNRGSVNLFPSTNLILGSVLANAGTVTLQSGSRVTVQETLRNETSGTITLQGDAQMDGSGALENGGQIFSEGSLLASSTNRIITAALLNQALTGFVDVLADTLTLAGGGENFGDIEIHAGTVLVIQGVFENAAGGLIHGAGTLDVSGATFTNNGTISPGSSPGILMIVGDLTLGATSQLDLELGGPAGADFDRLQILGSFNAGGTLNLLWRNGYIPAEEDSFDLLAYQGFGGDFADVTGVLLPNGEYMMIQFGPNGLKTFACLSQSPRFGFPFSPLRITCTESLDSLFSIPMCNTGGCPLLWSASFAVTDPLVPNWLEFVQNAAGFLRGPAYCAEIGFMLRPGALLPGRYSGILTVNSNDDLEPVREIPVSMRVRVTGEVNMCNEDPERTYSASILLQPRLTATVRGGQLKLNWNRIPGADYYQILGGAQIDSLSAMTITYDSTWSDTNIFAESAARKTYYQVVAMQTESFQVNNDVQDLIASWLFEEGDGSVSVDETGNGHDANLHNAEWYLYDLDAYTCFGLNFGSSRWADVANDDVFFEAPLQIDAHLKLDHLPGSPAYVIGNARYAPNNGGFAWRIEPNGMLLALVWNGSAWNQLRAVVPVPVEEWFTATLIMSGDESLILIDGIVVAAGMLALDDHNNNMPLTIGASALPNGNHQYYLPGQIGWIKVRTLASPE